MLFFSFNRHDFRMKILFLKFFDYLPFSHNDFSVVDSHFHEVSNEIFWRQFRSCHSRIKIVSLHKQKTLFHSYIFYGLLSFLFHSFYISPFFFCVCVCFFYLKGKFQNHKIMGVPRLFFSPSSNHFFSRFPNLNSEPIGLQSSYQPLSYLYFVTINIGCFICVPFVMKIQSEPRLSQMDLYSVINTLFGKQSLAIFVDICLVMCMYICILNLFYCFYGWMKEKQTRFGNEAWKYLTC